MKPKTSDKPTTRELELLNLFKLTATCFVDVKSKEMRAAASKWVQVFSFLERGNVRFEIKPDLKLVA